MDVSAAAGLDEFRHETGAVGEKWFPETMGAGAAFIDYDGDHLLDILLVGGGSWKDPEQVKALWLYRNNGDGTFYDATAASGLDTIRTYGFGITVADYDNDGDEDFFLTTLYANMLFRNDGGTFTEVGSEAGLAGRFEWSTAALFFDADRDGWLDLYVGNYVDWSPEKDIYCTQDGVQKSYCTPVLYEGISGRLYRNNGNGTFTDMTEASGFHAAPGMTLGAAMLDFNDDGWPDLVVANDTRRDLLYRNNGDGTFTEKGVPSGIAFDQNGRARAGMGVDAGVVDTTGRVSIFVGNFSNEMMSVFRHAGGDLFDDRAAPSRIGRASLPTLTFGLFLSDINLDGHVDLFAANGHVHAPSVTGGTRVTHRQPPQLFVNRGDGTFDDASQSIGGVLSTPLLARGAAYGDFDRDGDVDFLITENGGAAHLWRNDLSGKAHFLRVRLSGRSSNRDGVGAKVVIAMGDRRMSQHVRTGSSYLSQSEKVLTFGLGEAAEIDSVLVAWPSGQIDGFANVPADTEVRITEGGAKVDYLPLVRANSSSTNAHR